MKRYVEKEDVETTNELSRWVGVVLSDGARGAVLYIGDAHHIICNDAPYACNRACGGRDYDGSNIKDTLQKWKDATDMTGIITDIYCFVSYKELMTWFVEGMED
ncbi:MAG: hypothetical protein M0R51_15095 [Clostridia bacterium]|jgi:hypothetical protein|nr:hypothetical protein [Clostridia bacterium]